MSGILSFVKSKETRVSRTERFADAAPSKNKNAMRVKESVLLRPEKLPPYTGPAPSDDAQDPIKHRAVKFVFHRKEDMELFKRHFRVSMYIEASVSDPTFLLNILRALETGDIKYNEETGKFNG